jgi:threonine dehydrogenase-like Zn-dependent dehydrogenase
MNNGSMRAVGVIPAKRQVGILSHFPSSISADTQVKVRTIEVGICGTDREICSFAYGTPPSDSDYLVLGHEALGEVIDAGDGVKGLKKGDLVVPTVRRPCPHHSCVPCRAERQDFCTTGDFTERGIKMRHGFLTESFVEEEKHLTAVPPELRDVAVLVEPLTVAEKALAQVWQVQQRLPSANTPESLPGAGKTAVVLGAGPVGILGAMTLMIRGFRTFVYSRSPAPNPKADVVEAIGAKYISSQEVTVEKFAEMTGPVNLIYEAIGVADVAFKVAKILGLNGIYIFTGIPAEQKAVGIEADNLMRQMVLKNQIILGTVNADAGAFEAAIRDLSAFKQRWPKALQAVISGRYPMEAHRDLLLGKSSGIKNVIMVG